MSAQLRRLMIQANKLQFYVQLLNLKVEQHDQQTHKMRHKGYRFKTLVEWKT